MFYSVQKRKKIILIGTTVSAAAEETSLLWEKPKWGGRDLGGPLLPLVSARLAPAAVEAALEGGVAALGRPREGDGVAVGRPREGDGKLDSDTVDASVGKLLKCSLWEGTQEKNVEAREERKKEVTIVLDVSPCACVSSNI